MSAKVKHKNHILNRVFFPLSISLLFLFTAGCERANAKTKSHSRFKQHSHLVRKHHPTKEEELKAKEAAAREASEAKLTEGKNVILARAYKLYDSGTSESLQGNYKYSILQLKLADELLKEHGQTNSSLATVNSMALASCAQAGKDYPLARSTYDRLLAKHPEDIQILLASAKMETAQSNFTAAQNYVNRLLELSPNNAEGRMLADFIANKLRPAKR